MKLDLDSVQMHFPEIMKDRTCVRLLKVFSSCKETLDNSGVVTQDTLKSFESWTFKVKNRKQRGNCNRYFEFCCHIRKKYSQLLEELNVATMTAEMFGGEVLVPPLFVIIKV